MIGTLCLNFVYVCLCEFKIRTYLPNFTKAGTTIMPSDDTTTLLPAISNTEVADAGTSKTKATLAPFNLLSNNEAW
jgi:hypothetical protein